MKTLIIVDAARASLLITLSELRNGLTTSTFIASLDDVDRTFGDSNSRQGLTPDLGVYTVRPSNADQSLHHRSAGLLLELLTSSPAQMSNDAAADFAKFIRSRKFATILADPPWRFVNRTGKVAPEHRRLNRYGTLSTDDICEIPVQDALTDTAHCYLWVPNALLPDGLAVLAAWGFTYKSNIVWHKVRKDGGPDGRGVGFYFRNTTELLLFGTRGKNARTLPPGRRQVNFLATRKREHSRKPDEIYPIIEACSPAPRLEMFARGTRPNWTVWGKQADDGYEPTWRTYTYNSVTTRGVVAASSCFEFDD